MFNLPIALTARDRAANTFEKNLTRTIPRTDTPQTLPVPGETGEIRYHRGLLRLNALEQWLRGVSEHGEVSQEPLTLFQQSLVELADRLNDQPQVGVTPRARKISLEHEAARHIHETIQRILG